MITCKDTGETFNNYQDYLNSEHWKRIKAKFLKSKLQKGVCFGCGTSKDIHVHHKTYKRLGNEWLQDIVLLCKNCHKFLHDKQKDPTCELDLWYLTRRVIRHTKKKLSKSPYSRK